jgi:hypothetical protein
LFGGPPAFGELLHVGRPNIGDRGRFIARINDMFDRRWLSNDGPFAQELEQKIATLLGVKHLSGNVQCDGGFGDHMPGLWACKAK